MIYRNNSLFNIMLIIAICVLIVLIPHVKAQEYWQSTEGPYGGPIECIVYNSLDEVFAFTHWSGLFYSANNGETWIKRSDHLASKAVVDANDVIITNPLYSTSIQRSSDGGQTWTTYTNVINANRVYCLAVNSSNLLFAGTNTDGIFRSEDGGATWVQINNGMTYQQVNSISTYGARIYIGTTGGKVFRSNNNGDEWEQAGSAYISETEVRSILHVSSTILLAGTASRIYRSIDNGTTWTEVANGLTSVNNLIKSADNRIYANTYDGVYRSDNEGLNWSPVNNGLGNTSVYALAASSTNVLMAGTWYGFDNGIYRSSDHGLNWSPANIGLRGVRIWKIAAAPNGNIYAAAYSSGMFRSVDNGSTWQPIYSGLKERASSQSYNIRALAVSPQGTVYIGTYGAGVFISNDDGTTWTQVINGLPTWISGLACGQTPGLLYAGTYSDGIYKSTNYGSSWMYTGSAADTFRAYDLMVSSDENIVYAGSAEDANVNLNGMWRSPDGGTTWQQVGTGDLTNANVRDIIANSHGNIFVATSDFGLFRSTDGGSNWDNPDQGLLSSYFLSLAMNRLDHVFVGGGGVYVSKNNGDNWNYIPAGMPDIETHALTIDPAGYIFNGTKNGVYKSLRPTTQVRIRFSVKMLYVDGFNPATDTVTVRGNFNNWGSAGDNIYFEPVPSDPDLTYIGEFVTNSPDTLAGWIADDTLRYKFIYTNTGGDNYENSIPNRTAHWDHLSDLELPVSWFDEPANNSADAAALTALYNNTGGSLWTNKDNWLTDRPFSQWYGVSADNQGRVIGLSLVSNNLSGSIPKDVGQCKQLKVLNLFNNSLSGAIPAEIGTLPELVILDLRLNELTESIPSSFEDLTNLEELCLGSNQLTGTVPAGIWDLIKLKILWLANNQFSETLPSGLGNLTQLTHLYLENNQFSGSIPDNIGNLKNLIFLQLYNNQLTGSIPKNIGNLTNLEYFRLNGNQLDGLIPEEIGSLLKVREIDLQVNQLSGAVPVTITNVDSLRNLYLQTNKIIDLPNLTPLALLKQLQVQNNRLTFEDIEPNISIPNFTYSPQDSVGNTIDTTVYASGNISFNVEVGGTNNLYQWYHNGIIVEGATENVYNIYLAKGEDNGIYTCRITNTIVTGLTLIRRPIRLVVQGAAPPVPVLSSPSNGSTDIAVNPTLIWEPPVGAGDIRYHLQVHTSSDFDILPLYFDKDSIISAEYTLEGLNAGTTYYWRVSARNEFGTSDWSTEWNFTTISAVEPNPPVLSSPANNASGVSVFPTFQWTSAAGTYHIQIDNDGDCLSPFIDVDTLIQQQFTVHDKGLAFGSQHYWRVAVTVGGVKSDWSEIRSFTTETYPADIQLENTTTFPVKGSPGDFVPTDYQIFGIPGDDSIPLGDLLEGTAGTNWQAYWDNGQSSSYMVKFDKSVMFTCVTGRAFWLVSNGSVSVYMKANPSPLNSKQQAEIDVHLGWNLITDPFPFAVSWDMICEVNEISVPLWSFTGNVGSLWTQVNSMQPYVGYYFDNVSNLSKLVIPYKPVLGKPVAVAPSLVITEIGYVQWWMMLSIESGGFRDNIMQIGITEDAQAGWDQYDYRKPRGVGHLPGIYIDHGDWEESPGVYASDFRPPQDAIERWYITVSAEAGAPVTLSVLGVESVPVGQEVFLVDREHLCTVNLREQSGYSFVSARPENALEILVGSGMELEQELHEILPQEYKLGKNYPNPFNPATTIPVTVPQNCWVNLKVYNLLGQEIKILYNGMLPAGRHYFKWDGTNQAGQRCPSGIYLYHMERKNEFKASRRMILMK